MSRYLTICLFAPIGSMGATVSGARRTTDDHPTRSLILGVVAASLGIERTREQELLALEAGYEIGMLVERPGEVWTDFHTTQVPKGNKGWTTRAAELDAVTPDDNPVISWRDYRSNVVVFVALWANVQAPYTLDELREALRRPRFAPYMGRKCCPFGLPLSPEIVEADTPSTALIARAKAGPEREALDALRGRKPTPFLALEPAYAPPGLPRIERPDRLVSRERWQFLPRSEVIVMLDRADLQPNPGVD